MSLKLAIWDVDGTLIDSRQVIQNAMARAFVDVGRPPPTYEQTRLIVGLSLHDAMAAMAPDLEGEGLNALVEAYRAAFVANRADGRGHEPLYAGAHETLTRLVEAGWLMAIATGKSRRGLRVLFDLHGIEPLFDTIWCADDGPGKPHPFMVQEAIRALGVHPDQTVMIGDTAHDMTMARRAGIAGYGVTWGFHTADEIRGAGADLVFEDFAALNMALDRFAVERVGQDT
jgi:phosphoglycolate phosphatase